MESADPQQIFQSLISAKSPVALQYKLIFQLTHIAKQQQEVALLLPKSFPYMHESSLLQHEICYTIGQLASNISGKVLEKLEQFLKQIILDDKNYAVVRHEAIEGLSHYPKTGEIINFLEQIQGEEILIKSSKEIALAKLKLQLQQKNSEILVKYGTFEGVLEPAAPFIKEELKQKNIRNDLTEILSFMQKSDIFEQYRGLYTLRDLYLEVNNKFSIDYKQTQKEQILFEVCQLLNQKYFQTFNELFRHEVCFVLGQISHKNERCIPQLKETIADQQENEVVRHEAISAYQAMCDDKNFIQQFLNDPKQIVRESVIVTLDLIDYWQ